MRSCLSLAVLCFAVSGCSRSQPVTTGSLPPGKAETDARTASPVAATADYVVSEPITHGNLTVFPVLSKVDRNEDRFITLDEGLKAGTVDVYEVGVVPTRVNTSLNHDEDMDEDKPVSAERSGDAANADFLDDDRLVQEDELSYGDVNRLMVVNRSDKPLYLMPGEVIIGGSQDRTIGQSGIIAAHSEPTEIDVYCVEHGRWGQRAMGEAEQVMLALTDDPQEAEDLADAARKGKFVVQGGLLNKGSRVAAADGKGQQQVWDEVAKANGKLNVNSSSGAFTYNFVNKDVIEKMEPYHAAFEKLAAQDRVVGVIVAINGKAETVDVFESTPLFRKYWPKLMTGYCLDALHAADDSAATDPCDRDSAQEFLLSVVQGQSEETERSKDGLVVSRRENDKSVSFSAGGAMGGMGGMGGGAVHSSGFSK